MRKKDILFHTHDPSSFNPFPSNKLEVFDCEREWLSFFHHPSTHFHPLPIRLQISWNIEWPDDLSFWIWWVGWGMRAVLFAWAALSFFAVFSAYAEDMSRFHRRISIGILWAWWCHRIGLRVPVWVGAQDATLLNNVIAYVRNTMCRRMPGLNAFEGVVVYIYPSGHARIDAQVPLRDESKSRNGLGRWSRGNKRILILLFLE